MEEETDANYADSFDEADFAIIFPYTVRYMSFALVAHSCAWCMENMM
jgi:hypothetical protein